MFKHKNKNIISFLAILLIGVICFVFMYKWSWQGKSNEGYNHIIDSDGKGYYLYLTNTFLEKNISNQPIDNRFIFENKHGKAFNKYYIGTSVLMSPFFVLGHTIAKVQKDKTDGFLPPYHKAISLGGIFYLLLGLYFIVKLLMLYEFKNWVIITSLFLITFGTNLFSYVVLMPAMSHIYSFFSVAVFLFFYKKYFKTNKVKYHYLGLLFLCLIILIRPLNGLIVLALPLLSGSWGNFKLHFLSLFTAKIISISAMIMLLLFIQPLFWYLQTEEFILWNYKNEGFEFLSPHFYEVLIGFRKGWFIYTPLAFLSFLGTYFWYKKNRFEAFSFTLFFVIVIYFVASWWNWYYGPSFSQRPFVEFYPVLIISMAHLISSKIKYWIIGVSLIFVGINLIQNYQYQYGIISTWDMSWKKYKYTFLKTDNNYQGCLGGNRDLFPYNAKKENIISSKNNFESEVLNWNTGEYVISNGNTVSNYNEREFNTTFEYAFSLKNEAKRGLFIDVELDKIQLKEFASQEALIVIETSGENNFTDYYTIKLDENPSNIINKQGHLSYAVEIPAFRGVTGKVKIYVWNKNKGSFYIDNFSVTLSCVR